MTKPEDALARAKTGELEGGDLAGIKLPKANLAGARLRGAAAGGANLRAADLRDADLSGADLSAADLRNADLSGADLTGANLKGVRAKNANFTGAKLAGAVAVNATFAGAVFRDAELPDADFTKADLRRCRFERANLRRARLSAVDAAGAEFIDVDLAESDLRDAGFQECRLERVKFDGAALSAADFSLAALTAVDFSRAGLANAQFVSAVLADANFAAADLAGAVFDGSEQQTVDYQQANVKKASFRAVYGCPEEMLRRLRGQGAVIDRFLFRRFWRWLRGNRAARAVAIAAIVAVFSTSAAYLADPHHWSFDTLQRRAAKKMKAGEYAKGIRLYRAIIENYAADRSVVAAAKLAIANADENSRQYAAALKVYQEVADSGEDPADAMSAWEAIARVDRQLGQVENAKAIYEKMRQDAGDNPAAKAGAEFGLAELLRNAGRKDEALAQFLAIFDEFPAEQRVAVRAMSEIVATLCDLGRLSDAEQMLDRLNRYAAPSSEAWRRVNAALRVAGLRQQRGDFDGAEKVCRQAYDAAPDLAQGCSAGYALIDLHQSQGKFKEAEELIANMRRRSPTDNVRGELLLREARLWAAQGRTDRAIAALADGLPGVGDKAQADAIKLALGQLRAARGQSAKAQAAYRDVLRSPSSPESVASAKLSLASELWRVGATDKAEPLYRELYEKGGVDDWQTFAAATALAELIANAGRLAESNQILAEVERRWRDWPERRPRILLTRARVSRIGRNDNQALAQLRPLLPELREASDRFDGYLLMIELSGAVGELPAAEAAFRQLETWFGGDREKMSQAKASLAKCYEDNGIVDKAAALRVDRRN